MKRIFLFFAFYAAAVAVCVAEPQHNAYNQPQGGPMRHHRPRIECASPEQMELVMQVLEKQSFDDGRADVARLCVTLGRFCTRDLKQMSKVFSFDDQRLKFLQYAYNYCTDPQNYPLLREVFTFESNYDALMKYVYGR